MQYSASPCPSFLSSQEQERRFLRKRAGFAGLSMLLAVVLQLFLSALMTGLVQATAQFFSERFHISIQLDYYLFSNLLTLVVQPISLLLPGFVLIGGSRLPLGQAIPLKKPKIGVTLPAIGVMMGISSVGLLIYQLLYQFTSLFGVRPVMADMGAGSNSPFNVFLYFLTVAVLPSFLEEFLFRGALLQSFRVFGDGFAILLSALMFSLLHGNLIQAPNAFLMGLGLGFFAVASHSLWVPILIHFVNNASAVILDLIYPLFPVWIQSMLSMLLNLGYIIWAVLAAVWLMKKYPDLLKLTVPFSYMQTKEKLLNVLLHPAVVGFICVMTFFIVLNFGSI